MINAKIIAHSKHKSSEVITFELEYPRYIHAELMTHRVFSRNAASSRAIPIEKVIEQVHENTVMPIWTKNQAGMQGKRITCGSDINILNCAWLAAAESTIQHAENLSKLGAHKQNVNRILEPFQHIKVIVTTSQLTNWFNLRAHPDAQPEIQQLAKEMLAVYSMSSPTILEEGEWHLPYADGINNLVDAKMVSASCCAQVSYRKNDDSIEKAKDVYARLVGGKPIHASPFEHQCRPLEQGEEPKGNLVGWHQLRQDIEETM